MTHDPRPFQMPGPAFGAQRAPLREAITLATRRDEPSCVQALMAVPSLSEDEAPIAHALALDLAASLRGTPHGARRDGLMQALMREFALSSQEGVALMCLAEALLRIPDEATRDALIRDKLAGNDWAAHLGHSPSLFVNATTWGLVLTGKLVGTHGETGLRAALKRAVAKGGEPVIRRGVDVAMRMLGEQFVLGEDIGHALQHARRQQALGYRHSYDMLGEAALTDEDALRYLRAYEDAITAIATPTQGRDLHASPGISVKLSALHPRYERAQYARVMDELYPRLLQLAKAACARGIGLNIDAEESERLDLSLDLLTRLCQEPALRGWQGIGTVVQAYQKRAPHVVAYLIDLARRSQHRLMVRLVKGAYWDSEIKRAQLDGLPDYPVFTRKAHTDLCYLVCARQLLSAPDAIYPQFATHNAHTVAAIHTMAGPEFQPGQYEFQCLHGMGEALYDKVLAPPSQGGLGRPCRIYAPVGSHDTLLAYLVRRLLENGANTSFVHRVLDHSMPLAELVESPLPQIQRRATEDGLLGAPHPALPLPEALFGHERLNSTGLDLHDDAVLAQLYAELSREALPKVRAQPLLAFAPSEPDWQLVRNPADRRDTVGQAGWTAELDIPLAAAHAAQYAAQWQRRPVAERAAMLERAADLLAQRTPMLLNLLVREAGKTLPDAVGEVREAIDFLRYYAAQARTDLQDGRHQALGALVCISPWNFPLAIYVGQVAAALAAGNTVLAKPAEQTPLIAMQATLVLHEAGIPPAALQMLPGTGEQVGALLVAQRGVRGVLFTGSTHVARLLQAQLSTRVNERGQPLLLVAETGGQNAMIVDSSALVEQVVQDVLISAFNSAGQRCSALRVLCLQEDVAERVLHMLQGAMSELRLGPPDQLHTDVGPLIDQEALEAVELHVATMHACDRPVFQAASAMAEVRDHSAGCFAAPSLIELHSLDELVQEVFGPVLHVLRFKRPALPALLARLRATGYGLTMGVHSRIDETIHTIVEQARVGNVYVNRPMISAVVGVQPFGGEGLSGTGPKAGGPLYLHRLVQPQADTERLAPGLQAMARHRPVTSDALGPLRSLCDWFDTGGTQHAAALKLAATHLLQISPVGLDTTLPGPTGERNRYRLRPLDAILCLADAPADLLYQLCHVLAADSHAVWLDRPRLAPLLLTLPLAVRTRITLVQDVKEHPWQAVLMHADTRDTIDMAEYLAEMPGPIRALQALPSGWRQAGGFSLWRLLREQSVSVNTAAAGGNASLLSLG